MANTKQHKSRPLAVNFTVDETARSAYAEARILLPSWTSMARVMTRNRNMRVVLASHGRSETDGKSFIRICVPRELANLGPHDGRCKERDELKLILCNRCRQVELANIIVIHEISHIVEQTFEAVSLKERAAIIRRAIDSECEGKDNTSRAVKLRNHIENAPEVNKQDYLNLLHLVSPYLSMLFNAAEDVRVNRLMQESRPGTKIMFEARTNQTFVNGIKKADDQTFLWKEAEPNAQAMIGVYCKVSGFDYATWLDPKVVEDLDDPDLAAVCEEMKQAPTARAMYRLTYPLLECFRRLGYFKAPDDIEDDEPPPPPPPEEDEQEKSEEQEPEPEPDNSDSEDGADAAEGEQGDGDDSKDEEQSDGEGTEGSSESDSSDPDDGMDDDGGNGESSTDGDDSERDSDSESTDGDDHSESPEEENFSDSDRLESTPDVGDESTDSHGDSSEGSDGDSDTDSSDLDSEADTDSSDLDGEDTTDEPGDNGSEESSDDVGDQGTDGHEPAQDDASQHASGDEGTDSQDDPSGDPGDLKDSDEAAPEPYTEADQEADGTPDVVQELLNIFGGHADQNEDDEGDQPEYTPADESQMGPQDAIEEAMFQDALERAIEQVGVFDAPSVNILGIKKTRREDWDESGYGRGPWATGIGKFSQIPDISESILTSALQRLRLAFQDNMKASYDRNLKSGRVDRRALGKRIATNDPRLFHRKSIPSKKDYFVIVGLDCSGSTSQRLDRNGENVRVIDLIKQATFAKCELLWRLGITFAVYGHSGDSGYCAIYEVKSPEEPWGKKQQESLAALQPTSANLDGHTLEFYRKVAQGRRETDKIILYYTDGAMPLSNYDEELEILQREIKMCNRLDIKIVGVGIRNDDPNRHGLDTIRLDNIEDVPKVVTELRKRLLSTLTPS